jgi:protein SCO1/2
MNETLKPRILLALFAALSLSAAGCSKGAAEPPLKGSSINGRFSLTDQDGRPVEDSRFKGKYRIVYFGFTHCPDVCPTDLVQIGQGLKRFEKEDPARAARVQPIFISVDPERDSPAVLKQFVSAFHPRLIGLTGTEKQLADAKKNFAVYSAKEPTGGTYTVNHSRITFLLGPEGEPITMLPADKGAEAVAAELDRWVS